MKARSSIAAYDLFRAVRDTADIAYLLNITEAEALKQISQSRSAKLGLSDPYERQSVPVGERASAKVPFAGRVRLPTEKQMKKAEMENRLLRMGQ